MKKSCVEEVESKGANIEPLASRKTETHAAHTVKTAFLHVDIMLDGGNKGVVKRNAPHAYSQADNKWGEVVEAVEAVDVVYNKDMDEERSISPAYSDYAAMNGAGDDGRYHSTSPPPSPVYSEYGEEEVVTKKVVRREGEDEDEPRDEVVDPLLPANPANPILNPSAAANPNLNPDPPANPTPNANPNVNPNPAVNPNLNPDVDPANPNPIQPINIPELGVSQRRQAFLVESIHQSLYSSNLSVQQRTVILDTLALSLLLFGAPPNLVQELSTGHRLTAAANSKDPSPIPIYSYSHCLKCDHLKKIKWVDDCACRKKHSNLVMHKLDGDGAIKTTSSVVCEFDKAPMAKLVKPCSQELAVDRKGTGDFEPGRQCHFTNVTDWIHSFFRSPTIKDDLSVRFQFEQDRPQPGGSNFTCEYMKDCMKMLPEGSLSQANWQNLVLLFNVDWFGKSKNIQGQDAHMGGFYGIVVNFLNGQQHHPKFVLQYCQMEGKEPHDMSPIMDRLYEEMLKLSKDGTLVTLFDGQKLLVRAFLWEMINDGEARGKAAGMKSKNHRMPCMYCMWCPLRGEHKMHAIFNMTEVELINLHNGLYDREPTFDLKNYMREWMNATTMIQRKEMEQETGMEYSTLFKLIDVCDIRRFFGPDGMHLFGGIFFNLTSSYIYIYTYMYSGN